MIYGITYEELELILKEFRKYPQIQKAVLFGSRAMGREKKGSDIDIALKGENLSKISCTISSYLNEESPLPYYFDIIDYDSIESSDFREHIDRVGKEIYTRSTPSAPKGD